MPNEKEPTQYELEGSWTTVGIPGVNFRYSDLVRIKSGEHSGQTGEVIALISTKPEPVYGIVLPPNEKFAVLPQSELEPTNVNRGGTLRLMPPGSKPFKTD